MELSSSFLPEISINAFSFHSNLLWSSGLLWTFPNSCSHWSFQGIFWRWDVPSGAASWYGPAGVRHSAMEIRMCKGKPYECAEPIKRRQEQLDHRYHWLKGCGLVWEMLVGRGQILKSWHKMPKSLSFVP